MLLVATYTCPNSCVDADDQPTDMEANHWDVKDGSKTTHICGVCGYSEVR